MKVAVRGTGWGMVNAAALSTSRGTVRGITRGIDKGTVSALIVVQLGVHSGLHFIRSKDKVRVKG